MKILVTCPPMLGMIDAFRPRFEGAGVELAAPEVVQTLTVPELEKLVPEHDGWIIGDDPATREVFTKGKAGRLKAAVKWGVGVDNVDFQACEELGIPVANTPAMFGAEVADVAMGYVIALARETFDIDRGIRAGEWPKPRGISLAGKTAAVVGLGDIGRNTAKRLLASNMNIIAYDPNVDFVLELPEVDILEWPDQIQDADFIVITCALTRETRHMLNADAFERVRKGVRLVNVARGPIIDETALIRALESGVVYSAALEVFETEPLPSDSPLRRQPRCVFGSHNASNTAGAVERTSNIAIDRLFGFLGVEQ